MSRGNFIVIGVFVLGLPGAIALRADECTPPSSGPDVIVGEIANINRYGTVNGISGYTIGHETCNIGDAPVPWNSFFDHPVFAPNLYRLKDDRFEQIGLGWVKHATLPGTGSTCCPCTPGPTNHLGVGCSDVYDADYNGDQGLFGPRSEVNSFTGELVMPYSTNGQGGNAIYKRVQVKMSDLDPSLNPGAMFFAEVQVVAPSEAGSGNGGNSASYCKVRVSNFNGAWALLEDGPTRRKQPAIFAWQEFDPTVGVTSLDVPDVGRIFVAQKNQNNGDGTWHYDYAVMNLTSHRGIRTFSISVPNTGVVTNIGFHDVDYHSGEPYDSTDWPGVHENGAVSWSTQSFDENPNANALRWGTLYNFRFDADAPPGSTVATMGLFRPGTPDAVTLVINGPVVVVPTLSAGGLLLMGGLLAAAGWWVLRKSNRQTS